MYFIIRRSCDIIREELERHFNMSSEVLNDKTTKKYHADDYFKIELI